MRPLAVALCAALVLLLSGCGGGGTSKSTATQATERLAPRAWAARVCTSVQRWQKSLAAKVQRFQQHVTQVATQEGLAGARREFVKFFDEIGATTDDLVRRVSAVGPPNTPDGQRVNATVRQALIAVRAVFTTAEREAAKLPVNDLGAFQRATVRLSTSLETGVNAIDTARLQQQLGQTGKTMRSVRACQAIG